MKTIPFLLSIISLAQAATWTPQLPITEDFVVEDFVNLAYDPTTQQMFSAWESPSKSSQPGPASSVYNGTWGAPQSIYTQGYQDVFLSYNENLSQMFAGFGTGGAGNYGLSASYIGSAWSNIQQIPDLYSDQDVFITYNSGQSSLFAFINAGGDARYSIYSSGSWSNGQLIISDSIASPLRQIYAAYHASYNTQGGVFAGWADTLNNDYPTVYIYNNATSAWIEPPNGIRTIAPIPVDENIFFAYNTATRDMYATWSSSGIIQFSILADGGSSWTTTTVPGGTTPAQDVFVLYVPLGNQVFVSWVDNLSSLPYYAIYSDGVWTTSGSPITTMMSQYPYDAYRNVTLAFNTATSQVFAAWCPNFANVEYPDYWPYYSTYTIFQPIITEPVSSFIGYQKVNDFGTVSEYYNTLVWTPPQGIFASAYNLTKNGRFLATVPYSQLSYQDHDVKRGIAYTYSITALEEGAESTPVTVTIGGHS